MPHHVRRYNNCYLCVLCPQANHDHAFSKRNAMLISRPLYDMCYVDQCVCEITQNCEYNNTRIALSISTQSYLRKRYSNLKKYSVVRNAAYCVQST